MCLWSLRQLISVKSALPCWQVVVSCYCLPPTVQKSTCNSLMNQKPKTDFFAFLDLRFMFSIFPFTFSVFHFWIQKWIFSFLVFEFWIFAFLDGKRCTLTFLPNHWGVAVKPWNNGLTSQFPETCSTKCVYLLADACSWQGNGFLQVLRYAGTWRWWKGHQKIAQGSSQASPTH